MIPGVDVWSGYGRIKWDDVATAGYAFTIIKCQEGNDGRDHMYEYNLERATKAGLIVGAYHFAFPLPINVPGRPSSPGRSPKQQVELYWDACRGFGSEPGTLPPALDLEWPAPENWATWGCTPQQISDWAREACELMHAKWGRRPIAYTYPHWWRSLAREADVAWAGAYPLWIADYSHQGPGTPPDGAMPRNWSWVSDTWADWAIWQHSAKGSTVTVPGIPARPVDRNAIRDMAMLRRLAGVDVDAPCG